MAEVIIIGPCMLILGDCRDVVPGLGLDPKKTGVVSDVPYGGQFNFDSTRFSGGHLGAGRRSRGRKDRVVIGDDEPFDPTPWLDYVEVILWGANHFSQRLPVGAELIWVKRAPHHYGTFMGDAERAWKKGGKGMHCFYAPDSVGRRVNEAGGGEAAHPCQKPLALMDWCIRRTKAPLILDPYAGSMTTAIAAMRLGRRVICIEVDPVYFAAGVARVRAAWAQPGLFPGEGA